MYVDDQPGRSTAFRVAEKKYQLHKDQEFRRRNGRVRGGRLVIRPTDLSEVINVQSTELETCLSQGRLQEHTLPGSDTKAYTFVDHPGLLYIPAAIPAGQQQALAQAALEEYPGPPSRTNHSADYGPLPGLWRAAQLGWRLNFAKDSSKSLSSGQAGNATTAGKDPSSASAAEAPQHLQADNVNKPRPHSAPNETSSHFSKDIHHGPLNAGNCSPAAAAAAATAPPLPSSSPLALAQAPSSSVTEGASATGAATQAPANDHSPTPHQQGSPACASLHVETSAAQPHQEAAADCSCDSEPSSPASSCSSGSDALSMGEDTSTSGRSFDECWSADGSGPQASHLLRKLRWATLGPQFNWTKREYEFDTAHRPLPETLETLAKQMAALVDNFASLLQPGSTPAACKPYQPDAALVNYYYEGDTLGGHRDDVEKDLTQPIVSVSLGCDAIFLMGGLTRDTSPTAILVRSGDVVVLAHEARQCYHGVPRIFTDSSLPPQLDPRCVPQDVIPHVEHLAQARVNISIRAIR